MSGLVFCAERPSSFSLSLCLYRNQEHSSWLQVLISLGIVMCECSGLECLCCRGDLGQVWLRGQHSSIDKGETDMTTTLSLAGPLDTKPLGQISFCLGLLVIRAGIHSRFCVFVHVCECPLNVVILTMKWIIVMWHLDIPASYNEAKVIQVVFPEFLFSNTRSLT